MLPFYLLSTIGREAKRSWRVLDVGCGTGARSKWAISSGCDVTGIDIRNYLDDYSKSGLKFIQTSLEHYCPDQQFDVVTAMFVLPFIKGTWNERIAHLTRLMAPGALLLFNVFAPDDPWASEADVVTITEEALRDLLRRHKLEVRYRCHER